MPEQLDGLLVHVSTEEGSCSSRAKAAYTDEFGRNAGCLLQAVHCMSKGNVSCFDRSLGAIDQHT